MKETTNGNGAYNVVTTGFGYINRVREVAPEGAEPYLACDLSLMEGVARDGDYSKVNNVRFGAIVKGKEAQAIVRQHLLNAGDEVPVVASVSCGGIRTSVFTYKSGEKAGQQGVSLKTSLLAIKWLKVGDTVVDLGHDGETAPAKPEEQPAPVQETEPATDEVAADGTPAFAGELEAELEANGSVKLSKDASDFGERKTFVKEVMGLRWNSEQVAWVPKSAA